MIEIWIVIGGVCVTLAPNAQDGGDMAFVCGLYFWIVETCHPWLYTVDGAKLEKTLEKSKNKFSPLWSKSTSLTFLVKHQLPSTEPFEKWKTTGLKIHVHTCDGYKLMWQCSHTSMLFVHVDLWLHLFLHIHRALFKSHLSICTQYAPLMFHHHPIHRSITGWERLYGKGNVLLPPRQTRKSLVETSLSLPSGHTMAVSLVFVCSWFHS